MKQILLFLAAAAVGSAVLPPASGTPSSDERTQVVHFADLDLGSEHGLRILRRRIADAAATLCGPVSDVDLEGKKIVRRCQSAVMAKASTEQVRAIASDTRPGGGKIRLTLERPQSGLVQLTAR